MILCRCPEDEYEDPGVTCDAPYWVDESSPAVFGVGQCFRGACLRYAH